MDKPIADCTKEEKVDYGQKMIGAEMFDKVIDFYNDGGVINYEKVHLTAGYKDPHIVSDVLQEFVPNKDAMIADIGCGTGFVGEALTGRGYTNLHAFDPSDILRKGAEEKNLYKSLASLWIGTGKEMAEDLKNKFDGLISVGAFLSNHIGKEGFDDLLAMCKPGGFISFNFRDDQSDIAGYEDYAKKLAEEKKWKEVKRVRYTKYPGVTPKEDPFYFEV